MGSHVVVNSSIEPRLKSTRLIDGEVKGIMDNLTNIGLSFDTCNGIIFNKIQASCGTTYPEITQVLLKYFPRDY